MRKSISSVIASRKATKQSSFSVISSTERQAYEVNVYLSIPSFPRRRESKKSKAINMPINKKYAK
jgi:hypothetical protein